MRSMTVAGRAPLRNACTAVMIAAASCPTSRGTGVTTLGFAGWQPEHDSAPAGASAAHAAEPQISRHASAVKAEARPKPAPTYVRIFPSREAGGGRQRNNRVTVHAYGVRPTFFI